MQERTEPIMGNEMDIDCNFDILNDVDDSSAEDIQELKKALNEDI